MSPRLFHDPFWRIAEQRPARQTGDAVGAVAQAPLGDRNDGAGGGWQCYHSVRFDRTVALLDQFREGDVAARRDDKRVGSAPHRFARLDGGEATGDDDVLSLGGQLLQPPEHAAFRLFYHRAGVDDHQLSVGRVAHQGMAHGRQLRFQLRPLPLVHSATI